MENNEFKIQDGVLVAYNGKGGDVVIPDGVTEIGSSAFFGCVELTSIYIPDSVKEIRGGAFNGCTGLRSINIPNTVTAISWYTFANCTGLKSINIPNSVEMIGENAFDGCSSLSTIDIPNSVTHIGSSAFANCTELTSITIPNSISTISIRAFDNCKNLTSVTIPNSVKKISMWAFYGCNNITKINCMSDSVIAVGADAFETTRIKHLPQGNVAYKGFHDNMTCRGFQYEEGKTYECDEAELCECGFHACLNPIDCFDYYYGYDVVYHEVILEDRTGETRSLDSKICGKKITIGRRLTIKEMFDIFNELNK